MKDKDCKSVPTHHKDGRRILFTGPDGIGNYRVKRCDFPHSIGIGDLPPENTGDLNYLFRPAPNTPPWQPKQCYVGGVGWGIEHGVRLNGRTLRSNTQIKRSEFCSVRKDRVSQISHCQGQATLALSGRQMPSGHEDRSADVDHGEVSENQIRQRKRYTAQWNTPKHKTPQSDFTLPPISRHTT